MKTIAFYNRPFPCGGAEVVTRNLADFFYRHGYRVMLYTRELHEELLTARDREIFVIRPLPSSKDESCPENTEFFCRSLLSDNVDCLIVQGYLSVPFAEIRRRVPTKLIFCLHNMPLWEVRSWQSRSAWEISNPTLGRRLEYLLLRKPAHHIPGLLENRFLKKYAALLPHIDRLVMLCPEYRDQMQQLIGASGFPGSDAPAQRYAALLNPMLPAESPTEVPKQKTVLYVGRLSHGDKRVDRLLKIWKRIEQQAPDWKLVLVGTGPAEQNLRNLAVRLGLENAEFAGYRTDMASFYREATFMCLTSNFEGLPMSLMEGQQYGVIPVSFDSYAGIRTIACDGQCGLIVPAFDLKKYAETLLAAMHDIGMQERMRKENRIASERYDLEHIGQQWLQLLTTL